MTFALKKKLLLSLNRPIRPQDVFATSLYTGNGGTQTITNGLDLAGKGGLVWAKIRNAAESHNVVDTVRGPSVRLIPNDTNAELPVPDFSAFLTNGFRLSGNNQMNLSGSPIVAWSFRRAKKFFDIVTYTGNGQSGRQIPHGLGDVPGMIVVKRRSSAANWAVWHRSVGNGYLQLNTTDATLTPGAFRWGNGTTYIAPTASVFTVAADSDTNTAGETYVAYLFAHNPDLIDCGSYVGNGSTNGPSVTCGKGWRPQYILAKSASIAGEWFIADTARGIAGVDNWLMAQSSAAESQSELFELTSTGFRLSTASSIVNGAGQTYIYLAIRSPT